MIAWLLPIGLIILIFYTFGVPFVTGPQFRGRIVFPDLSALFGTNTNLIQLILAFVLPPAAVYMAVGVSTHFWLNILLTVLGWVPGVLHALWVMFFM